MNRSKQNTIIFFIVFIGVALVFFRLVSPFVMDALMAGVLAILFKPLFGWLNGRFPKRRNLNAFLVAILTVLLIILPLSFIGYNLVSEIQNMTGWVTQLISEWNPERLQGLPLFKRLPESIQQFDYTSTLLNFSKDAGSWLLFVTQSTFVGVSQFLVDFVFVVIFLVVFLVEGPALLTLFRRISPLDATLEQHIFSRLESVVDATIRGNVIVAVIEGLYAGVLLFSMNYPSPVFLAILATIFSFMPILGVNTLLIPLGLFRIFTGRPISGLITIVISLGVMALTQNFLKPNLVGARAGLHPVYILVATLGGLAWLGLPGFILGPVIAAFFLTGLELYAIYFVKKE